MPFDQTHAIYPLSDTLVDELGRLFPDQATEVGVAGHDDRWPDLSPDGAAAAGDALRHMRDRVDAVPPATNEWEALAIEVARDDLERQLVWYDHHGHLDNLNSIASPLQGLREVFDVMARDDAAAWENIAARLEGLGAALTGYARSLEEGRTSGRAVARRQVEEGIRQASVHASGSSSLQGLLDDFDAAGLDVPGLRSRLEQAAAAGRAAYADLAGYLRTTYAPSARESDPVGTDRYTREARRMLGTDLDLLQTYAWGWDQVAALRSRMEQVADEIAPGGGIAGAVEVLTTDPARMAATPEDLVAFLSARIDEALDRLSGSHFDVPEQIRRCDVKLAPPGGPLGAYYIGPSEDFSRPGSVWWSILPDRPHPLYDEVTTAYHEGFPGHHLQTGIQASLRERHSRLHRVWVWMSGTGEGWALYAERLMDELGYLDAPDYVFGYLAGQIHRACRVVIDIGSHLGLPIPHGQPFHPGEAWTFETAVEMLEEYATLDGPFARSEVTRYLGWPGQAISYKVGEREILRLRDELRRRDGDAFDLTAFHRRLLEVGPVGIDLMRRFVRND